MQIPYLFNFIYFFTLTATTIHAKQDLIERVSVQACSFHLAKLTNWDFQPVGKTEFYSTLCNYIPAFQSWSHCIYQSVNKENSIFFKSLPYIKQHCPTIIGKASDQFFVDDLYNEFINATKYMKLEPINAFETINYPIRINETLRKNIVYAVHSHSHNLDTGNIYGGYIYIYTLIVLFIGSILNYLQFSSIHNSVFKWRIIQLLRGYIIIPALGGKHASYFQKYNVFVGLLPSRAETLVIACYLIQHIYLLGTNYMLDYNNTLFASTKLQKIRFVADRAGILAFANLPLIILLSTRNNVCEFLANVKYSSFIMFHKWLGRIMFIDVIIHCSCYLAYAVMTGSLQLSLRHSYYQYGIIACFIFFVLVLFSLGLFRTYYYETFLYGHIILAILFIYCCWKHVENLGWKEWIISASVIWIAERLLRIFSIFRNGCLSADIRLIADNMIKVTIPKDLHSSSEHLSTKPGQYYYVYFMHPLIFWQSHPFTLLDFKDKIVMIIKPKLGATRTIYNSLKASQEGSLKINICLEGPYGPTAPIHLSKDTLLLGGGTGLPSPLAHAIQLATNPNFHSNVQLCAIVRDLSLLEAFRNEFLKLKNSGIRVNIYITGQIITEENSISITPSCDTPLLDNDGILKTFESFCNIYYQRPAIDSLIENIVNNSNSVSILCCGPPKFVDITRNITAKKILSHPDSSISYYEEYQTW